MGEFLSYRFTDPDLLRLALTHRSAHNKNNERLEFLGDAILGQVMADYLYRTFPAADEGQLTRTRARLVKKDTLAEIARELDVGSQVILGDGERKSGGWRRASILANTLESLIGAIYLDGGIDACTQQILEWFETTLADVDPRQTDKDPKTRLQEYLQGRGRALPEYSAVEVTGPPHDQRFTIECRIEQFDDPAVAQGRSRRAGEQGAAEAMLERLEVADR